MSTAITMHSDRIWSIIIVPINTGESNIEGHQKVISPGVEFHDDACTGITTEDNRSVCRNTFMMTYEDLIELWQYSVGILLSIELKKNSLEQPVLMTEGNDDHPLLKVIHGAFDGGIFY
jgi:hypothetical protein